jgi:hypothetical protein
MFSSVYPAHVLSPDASALGLVHALTKKNNMTHAKIRGVLKLTVFTPVVVIYWVMNVVAFMTIGIRLRSVFGKYG